MTACLVVAGTHSGVGKTSVTVGLCQAWRAMGLRVAVFKCGPDYLDPTYHARAAGVPCHNLDGWMMGREAVLQTYARVCAQTQADVALIEGVMGLFDGAGPTTEAGSTAEIAKWLQAPVLLVVDAGGMARSIAAMAHGFANFDPALRMLGVWCNRVGSAGHLQLLEQACRSHVPVLGGFTKNAAWAFPERHLGLHAARATDAATFAQLGEAMAQSWGHALRDLPRAGAGHLANGAAEEGAATPLRCRIGIAQDDAFSFYYEDNLARLRSLGAELVPFSPIHDTVLPAVSGLYIGGGYPELHAAALAQNTAMRQAIGQFTGPIYAECGGLMYMTQALQTQDGTQHPMVGRLPATAVMRERLQALGYVEVETRAPSPLGHAGLRFRGHQFRYSELLWHSEAPQVYRVRKRRGGDTQSEGYTDGALLASYVHAHWASNPQVAAGFVDRCAQ